VKVKSKTNANPTRQNSPRFSGKFSISHGMNPVRDSNNSKQTLNKNRNFPTGPDETRDTPLMAKQRGNYG